MERLAEIFLECFVGEIVGDTMMEKLRLEKCWGHYDGEVAGGEMMEGLFGALQWKDYRFRDCWRYFGGKCVGGEIV